MKTKNGNKAERVASAQWKLVKAAGADKALGHGGVYCLRSSDVTGNIVTERAKGVSKTLVAIIAGKFGVCYLQGAFVGKILNVGNVGIDTSKIKRVLFFGAHDKALEYVKRNGDAAGKVACHYKDASFVLGAGNHYTVAIVGKQLVRDEFRTNERGADFVAKAAK